MCVGYSRQRQEWQKPAMGKIIARGTQNQDTASAYDLLGLGLQGRRREDGLDHAADTPVRVGAVAMEDKDEPVGLDA